jgi:type II restriction enzyme
MNLQCTTSLAASYKAGSQIARVLSEEWCSRELYCPACDSDSLSRLKTNAPGADFSCPRCAQSFQLKSGKSWNTKKIVDAGYDAMIRAIRSDTAPNLLVLQYSSDWLVQNLLLVPRVFFSEAAIQKRPPLRSTARRAGWVGCNIVLAQIPIDGKIAIVSAGVPKPEQLVRKEFARVRKLAELPPSLTHFSLAELYGLEPELRIAHPLNQNVRPKIRQRLQVLRDLGLVDFVGRGSYVLRTGPG